MSGCISGGVPGICKFDVTVFSLMLLDSGGAADDAREAERVVAGIVINDR
jgi:hypothetical protein